MIPFIEYPISESVVEEFGGIDPYFSKGEPIDTNVAGGLFVHGSTPIGAWKSTRVDGNPACFSYTVYNDNLNSLGVSQADVDALHQHVYDRGMRSLKNGEAGRMYVPSDWNVNTQGELNFGESGESTRVYDVVGNRPTGIYEEFIECCTDCIEGTWSSDGFNPKMLEKLKDQVRDFLHSHAKSIREVFAYAEGKGRYQPFMNVLDTSKCLSAYTEYVDDLVKYIKALSSEEGKKDPNNDHVVKALKVDANFRENLRKYSRSMTFAEAACQLNGMVDLIGFIDFLIPIFTTASGSDKYEGEVKALMNLLGYSVQEFTKAFISKNVQLLGTLIGAIGKIPAPTKTSDGNNSYVLL